VNLAIWYFHMMHKGETKSTFVLFSEEAWFHLSGHMDSKNIRCLSA